MVEDTNEMRDKIGVENVLVSKGRQSNVIHIIDRNDTSLCGFEQTKRCIGSVKKNLAVYPVGHVKWCNNCIAKSDKVEYDGYR